MKKIKKALISVSDKKNLGSLLKILAKYKIKLISSGGTYKEIKKLNNSKQIKCQKNISQLEWTINFLKHF